MGEKSFQSTKQVLEFLGLSQDEIDTYFHLTGRGPVMVGEIALLVNVAEEEASRIAQSLLTKGLVREVPGKTPFYVGLPPYTALLNQISRFKEVVQNIQETTPKALELKFKEIEEHSAKLGKLNDYRNYIQMMKTNLPNQMKAQFSRVESELDKVKKFQEIRGFILHLREIVPEEIVKEFSIVETRLDKIKSEISESFEKTFRVGALKNMAEKIVSRVVGEQFHDLTDYFREKFVKTIQSTLDQVTDQLGSISDAAGEMSVDLSATLNDIEGRLKDTLEDLDQRISSVYVDVDKGIEELKGMFQKEIYKILEEDIITSILNQLDLSEQTMTEFWERSKQASMLSFKDVWFVRSVEGMKAQINESITRVKMRVHIIAPRLSDIDFVALKKVKAHVNVRISTDFDWDLDQEVISEIMSYPNFTLRHYPRKDIWAINRDFEEVVICVVSKIEEQELEIAGMGSILEEHVKLFAGVIEDVWIQSKRLDESQFAQEYKTTAKPRIQKEFSTPVIEKTVPDSLKIDPLQQKPSVPSSSTAYESVESVGDIQNKEKKDIVEMLEKIKQSAKNKNAHDLSIELEKIRNEITEELGYSSILSQISITIANFKTDQRILSLDEIDQFQKKIDFWKKKLKI